MEDHVMMQTPYRVAWFACLIIGLVSLMHGGAAPAQSAQDETEVVLLTDAEAEQLRVTDADLLLPVSTPMTSDGPHIVLRRPDITGTGKTPTVTTSSPTDLTVVFEPNRAPIDMTSLQVKARKGIFKQSLTERLQPYIQGTSIVAQKVKMPSGKFIIEIDIADQEGARTFQRYYLQVN
jgi:hypothetical protein